jgi:DNA-binding transcriptional MerR regulator
MERYFIGDIAKKFGLNPRTLRYYESIGILPKAGRTEGGYRVYGERAVERLEFVLKAKALGLKLDEIKKIIDLHERGEVPCECTKDFIRGKINEIEEKVASVTDLKERLEKLLRLKKHRIPTKSICPIITESEKGA